MYVHMLIVKSVLLNKYHYIQNNSTANSVFSVCGVVCVSVYVLRDWPINFIYAIVCSRTFVSLVNSLE